MSVSYLSIIADVESQINGLIATTPALTESTYSAAQAGTWTVADRTSTDWGLPQIQNAVFDAEYELLKEICFNGRHPERGSFVSASSALSSGVTIPAADAVATPYLGIFDYAYQTSTAISITERPMQVVQWAIANANSAFSSPRVQIYCLAGGIVLHNSSTTIVLNGPAVARATSTSGNIRLRDYHRAAVVAGVLIKLLPKEGAWPDAYKINADYYSAHIEQIRGVGSQLVMPNPAR
jgi:hypothetical protein